MCVGVCAHTHAHMCMATYSSVCRFMHVCPSFLPLAVIKHPAELTLRGKWFTQLTVAGYSPSSPLLPEIRARNLKPLAGHVYSQEQRR